MSREPKPQPHQGMALLRTLADRGQAVFTTQHARDAAANAGIGSSYLPQLLRRLTETSWINRIKRGTYVITAGIPGFPPDLHPFATGMALVDSCAVSGWSALNHHGLTEQVPRIITLTTPQRIAPPTTRSTIQTTPPIWKVGVERFELVSVIPAHFFGYEQIWLGENRVRILNRERALLDCFALPRRFGGVSEGLAIVEEHLCELDVALLVAHALQYGKVSVAKRVGYALELAGAAPDRIKPLRDIPLKGYRLLDPSKPARGRRRGRWGLRDNLRAEGPA